MVAWSPYRSSNRYWSHDPFPPIKALPNSFVMQIYFPPIRSSRINCVRRAYDTTIIPIPHPGGLGPFSCLSYNLDPFWPCYLPAVTDFFSPKISPTSARKKKPSIFSFIHHHPLGLAVIDLSRFLFLFACSTIICENRRFVNRPIYQN